MLLFDILLPTIIIGACFCAGVLVTIVVLLSYPVKLVNQEGLPPIVSFLLIGTCATASIVLVLAGGWGFATFTMFGLGYVLGIPFCVHFAPYLDDLKVVLCTPQRPGKRKRVYPTYPKQERMQEQPMAYYEEMNQR